MEGKNFTPQEAVEPAQELLKLAKARLVVNEEYRCAVAERALTEGFSGGGGVRFKRLGETFWVGLNWSWFPNWPQAEARKVDLRIEVSRAGYDFRVETVNIGLIFPIGSLFRAEEEETLPPQRGFIRYETYGGQNGLEKEKDTPWAVEKARELIEKI